MGFETRIEQAGVRLGRKFTAREVAAFKRRFAMVGLGADVDQVPDHDFDRWLERAGTSMQTTAAVVAAHDALANGYGAQAAPMLPNSLRDRLNRALDGGRPDGPFAAGETTGELHVTLAGDRVVRFDPATLVVTPLRADSR